MSVIDGLAQLRQFFVQKCRWAQGMGAKVAPNSCSFSFQLLHVATSQGEEDEQWWVMTRRDLKLAVGHWVSPAMIFATFWLCSMLNWGFRSVLESDISESYKHVTVSCFYGKRSREGRDQTVALEERALHGGHSLCCPSHCCLLVWRRCSPWMTDGLVWKGTQVW